MNEIQQQGHRAIAVDLPGKLNLIQEYISTGLGLRNVDRMKLKYFFKGTRFLCVFNATFLACNSF